MSKKGRKKVGSPLYSGPEGAEPSSCHLISDGSKSHPFPPCVGKHRDLMLQDYSLDGKPQKSIGDDHCCQELMQHLAVKIKSNHS